MHSPWDPVSRKQGNPESPEHVYCHVCNAVYLQRIPRFPEVFVPLSGKKSIEELLGVACIGSKGQLSDA